MPCLMEDRHTNSAHHIDENVMFVCRVETVRRTTAVALKYDQWYRGVLQEDETMDRRHKDDEARSRECHARGSEQHKLSGEDKCG